MDGIKVWRISDADTTEIDTFHSPFVRVSVLATMSWGLMLWAADIC